MFHDILYKLETFYLLKLEESPKKHERNVNFGLTKGGEYGMFMVFKEITFHETCFACFRYRLVTRPEAAETNPTGGIPPAVSQIQTP